MQNISAAEPPATALLILETASMMIANSGMTLRYSGRTMGFFKRRKARTTKMEEAKNEANR